MATFQISSDQWYWIIYVLYTVANLDVSAPTKSTVLCSDILCDIASTDNTTSPANCSIIVNECHCYYNPHVTQFSAMPIMCPNFSTLPLNLFYNRFNQILSLLPDAENHDFNTILQYFQHFLTVVEYQHLTLTSFCSKGIKKDIFIHASYKPTAEDQTSPLNVTHFPSLKALTYLSLEMNCFTSIMGVLSTVVPNLKNLNLNNNFLVDISDRTFSELRYLQELHLFNNRLQEIRPETLRDLSSLNELLLSNNNIEKLDGQVFSSLVSLERVILGYNRIKVIPDNLFRNNLHLKEITLTHNGIEHLPRNLFSNLTKLTRLTLNENLIRQLSPDLFTDLRKLEIIELHKNRLVQLLPDQFVKNYKLKSINLYSNDFTQIPELHVEGFLAETMPEVTLDYNNITEIEIPLTDRIKAASKLSLSHNCLLLINEINMSANAMFGASIQQLECRNCCLFDVNPKLLQGVISTADFNQNYIQKIDMRLLANVVHLDRIDLSNNLISTIDVNWSYPLTQDPNKTGALSNPQTVIILQSNLLNCDCHLYRFVLFMNVNVQPPAGLLRSSVTFDITDVWCIEPKALYGVRLSELVNDKELQSKLTCNVSSEDCPSNCSCTYAATRDVTIYNCNGQGLREFPQITSVGNIILHLEGNLIRNLPHQSSPIWQKIDELYLNNNFIASLENLTITPKLRILDLRNNVLEDFRNTVLSVVKYNVRLLLSGNPWKCNCDLQQVRSLIFDQVSVTDSKNLTCILPNVDIALYLSEASDNQLCPELLNKNNALCIYLPIFAAILILTTFVLTLLYRFKTEVQHWLFTHGYCLSFITEDDVDCAKTFDAFVSYSTLDEDWVVNHLVRGLETGTPPYSLCLHDRDWPVGEWIPDQIFRSVQESRRTIIVLTDNFVASDWSRLEFKTAHQKAIADQVNRLLIVVPGKLPDLQTIDEELRTYITLNTYLKWGDVHFWRKLRLAMPGIKTRGKN